MTNTPVLEFPRFGVVFVLETDASGVELSAILAEEQDNGFVILTSHTLQSHEQNYGVTELEALEVVWGVWQYLYIILWQPV